MTTSRSNIDTRPDGPKIDMGDPEPTVLDDVMVDIETMSLSKHNALILSVGLIEFNASQMDSLKIGATTLLLPNIERQLLLGREVSKGTQNFWKAQEPAASDHWVRYSGERSGLVETCHHIRQFCSGKKRVWANGTQFDLSNLEALNDQMGLEAPLWHYQAPRDMRTFVKETPATRLVPIGDALDIPGVPHEPVYDCIVQAWQVWAHYQG